MKYLLLTYGSPRGGDVALRRELTESGELIDAEDLADAVTARLVRILNGAPVITGRSSGDRPAGYLIIDVDGPERAAEVAARCRAAWERGVEVWPLLSRSGAEM